MSDALISLRLSPEAFTDLRTAFEHADHEAECYLDTETGEVLWYSNHQMSLDDEPGPDAPDWIRDAYEKRLAIWNSDEGRFLEVPPNEELETWRDMRDFLDEEASDALRVQFRDRPASRGTYRQFEDALERHPTDRRDWLRFHRKRLRGRIEEWLELNGYELVVED
jgi:hypothetical protein